MLGAPLSLAAFMSIPSSRLKGHFRVSNVLREGSYELSSGGQSDWYFDAKRMTMSEYYSIVISSFIDDTLMPSVRSIGGVAIGGVPMVASYMSYLSCGRSSVAKRLNGFYVLPSEKGHGVKSPFQGYIPRGEDVAVLDDVITTGASVMSVVDTIESTITPVKQVICLLDRREGLGKRDLPLERRGIEVRSLLCVYDGELIFTSTLT